MKIRTLDDVRNAISERQSTPRPRGSDIRKMAKPYTCREAVFTCSNGWTIELLPPEDHPVEGFFMGHCLGTPDSDCGYRTELSLREPDGTPHVTLSFDEGYPQKISRTYNLGGRCNRFPKPEYVDLVNELCAEIGQAPFDRLGRNNWGQDTDVQYHDQMILSDEDFRDLDYGALWRRGDWYEKRAEAV